jgi:ribosomal protein S18 acetylase RimI-like enzyme
VTSELRPASVLSLAERTSLFNAGYEDYVTPFVVDEAIVRGMTEWYDIDLGASRVAYRNGTPVGFANLAVRGEDGWIGGIGVVAGARRQGLGEALMHAVHEEARTRGVTRVWLEVIEQNEPAVRLYERLGYEVERELEVWTLSAEVGAGSGREVPAPQAHARIRALRHDREPWQRADGTLAHYDDALGLETANGAAVFRPAVSMQLVQIAGEDAGELLRTMRARGTLHALNLPVRDPAAEALRELGAAVAVRQREMLLKL